jgi:hypothetical protein
MTISSLPARYLGQHELTELVERLAGQPELWGDQVSYAGGRRHYASIHRDEYVDVWLICWSPGTTRAGDRRLVRRGSCRAGRAHGVQPRIGGAHVRAESSEGGSICFRARPYSPADRGGGAEHLRTPFSAPLWRLGQYTIDRRRRAACRSATPTNSGRSTRRPRSTPPRVSCRFSLLRVHRRASAALLSSPIAPHQLLLRLAVHPSRRLLATARIDRTCPSPATGRCGRRRGAPHPAGSAGTPRTAGPPPA